MKARHRAVSRSSLAPLHIPPTARGTGRPAKPMEVSFADCKRELLGRANANGRAAYNEWRQRPHRHEVVAFVEGFTHRHLFDLTPDMLRAVMESSAHPLGDVQKEEAISIGLLRLFELRRDGCYHPLQVRIQDNFCPPRPDTTWGQKDRRASRHANRHFLCLQSWRTSHSRQREPGEGTKSRVFKRSTSPITSVSLSTILLGFMSTDRFFASFLRSNTLASMM